MRLSRDAQELISLKEAQMAVYAGIDVSKGTLDLSVLKDGKVDKAKRYDNSCSGIMSIIRDVDKIADNQEIIYGCEATGIYDRVLLYTVYGMQHKIKRINPRYTKHEAMANGVRNQNDKADSLLIARRLEANRPGDRFWKPEHEGNIELRKLLKRREQLLQMKLDEENRKDTVDQDSFVGQSILSFIEHLKTQIELIEAKIYEFIDSDSKLKKIDKLLRTAPGVGRIISAYFIAIIGNIDRFQTAAQVVAYMGLSPLQKTSGTSVNRSRMSRQGDPQFRKVLYMGAMRAICGDNVYSMYANTLEERGKPYKYRATAVMRKMTRTMFAMWRDEEPFSEERYGQLLKKCA
jgi:transposase